MLEAERLRVARDRIHAALAFQRPDRIPVIYHPSPAGLLLHGERLLELFNRFPPDNPIRFTGIDRPPADAVDSQGRYHEIKTDTWGTEWEYLAFGLWGSITRYPISNWEDADAFVFPPSSDSFSIAAPDGGFTILGWVSIFEKLCSLSPMDEVFVGLIDRDANLMAFLDRLTAYWAESIARMIRAGADAIMFGDDWGTQQAPMVAPELFRSIFKPRYDLLMEPIRQAGIKIFFHSCGTLGAILPDLIDLGIDCLWPQLPLFEQRPEQFALCSDAGVSLYLHPDRQYLVPRGTPQEIEATVRAYAERYHKLGGGGLFYVEIENDAPFENVEALITAIDRYR